MENVQERMTKLSLKYLDRINEEVKKGVKEHSLLRKEMKVHYLKDGELPIIKNIKEAFVTNEDGVHIDKFVDMAKLYVPIYEIGHNPILIDNEIDFNEFEEKDEDNQEEIVQDAINKLISSIIDSERDRYAELLEYMKIGNGIMFIRMDLEILPAIECNDLRKRLGYFSFEQIGTIRYI